MSNGLDERDGASRIVVGVDGSEGSKAAMHWAARQAELTGSELALISTWEPPLLIDRSGPQPRIEDNEGIMQSIVESCAQELVGTGRHITVTTAVQLGHPAPILVDESERAALLVVGSRGHGAFVGMLLGSVSQFVATHARCPVVIVRDGEASEGAA